MKKINKKIQEEIDFLIDKANVNSAFDPENLFVNNKINEYFMVGNLPMLKAILENKQLASIADLNKCYIIPLSRACTGGHIEIIKYVLEKNDLVNPVDINIQGDSPIIAACAAGNVELVDYLLCSPKLKKHADIYAQDGYAFKQAYYYNKHEVINYLIFDYKMELREELMDFVNKDEKLKALFTKRELHNKLSDLSINNQNKLKMKI